MDRDDTRRSWETHRFYDDRTGGRVYKVRTGRKDQAESDVLPGAKGSMRRGWSRANDGGSSEQAVEGFGGCSRCISCYFCIYGTAA